MTKAGVLAHLWNIDNDRIIDIYTASAQPSAVAGSSGTAYSPSF